MVTEFFKGYYFLQELEEANGRILCDLVSMARFANISIAVMAKSAPHGSENLDLYFHTLRTIDGLRREADRQLKLLAALREELIHARDEDRGSVPPCVLFDYEKAEAV